MAADEVMQLRQELAALQRIVQTMHRMGRVHKVEDGRIRVTLGQGDVGDEEGQNTSSWIRTSHGGAQSHGEEYAEGETVHLFCAGGNMEHAHVVKGGYNDKHPIDGNDKKGNSTRRWRKKPEQQDQQKSEGGEGGSGGQGSYGDQDQNPAPQWKDDDDDHQEINSSDQRQHKLGKYSYTATKDGGVMKHGDLYVKCVNGKVEIGNGGSPAFTFDGKKIVVQAPIEDKNGKKFAVQGSVDNRGDRLVSSFANE